MRDYSFGNFISALREKNGLSQYQLGALVGVSDKAVSKWENGGSKPRIDTIRKLSEVLGISVDELLACEYDAFKGKRKDLFAMKNEIIRLASDNMKSLYGDNPPIRIVNRFNTEKMTLNGHEMILWMGFLGKLSEEACKNHFYYEVRGAQMGASFIAWLTGGTVVNPLPAHYYCPVCKTVEFVPDAKCGPDLLNKQCSCGTNYKKDGFGIDIPNIYPLSKNNEVHISHGAMDKVKKILQEYFSGYGIAVELRIIHEREGGYQLSEQFNCVQFVLLSEEKAKQYSGGIMNIKMENYLTLLNDLSVLTVIEDRNEQLELADLTRMDITDQVCAEYFDFVKNSGVFKDEIGITDLSNLLDAINRPSFSDLIAIYGLLRSSGAWENNAELLFEDGIPLSNLISCREDVYSYLYFMMNKHYGDNPIGQAFEIREKVRKGMYSNGRMNQETENLLLECDIPEWYVQSMKKIRYLFPKTQLILSIKRDICRYLKSQSTVKK